MQFIFKETIQRKPLFYFNMRAPAILTAASKSTNSLGYRELREPMRACENGYRLLLVITNIVYIHFDLQTHFFFH